MARRTTSARKKAVAHAEKFAQREEELQALAAEFFDLEDKSDYRKIQKRLDEYQQKIKELKTQSDEAEAELRAQQTPIIHAMKQAGETPTNIAVRLDVHGLVVRQALQAEKNDDRLG